MKKAPTKTKKTTKAKAAKMGLVSSYLEAAGYSFGKPPGKPPTP